MFASLLTSLGYWWQHTRPGSVRDRPLVATGVTDADLDDIAALLGDEQVIRYYPRPKTRDEAARWISWNRRLYAEHGFGLWAIRLIDSGEFVGECGLTIQVVDGVKEVEVGCHVMPAHQRRGYSGEAAACRDGAHEQFSIGRLIAVINPANFPSRAVAERIGPRLETHARMYGEDRMIYATPAAASDRTDAAKASTVSITACTRTE